LNRCLKGLEGQETLKPFFFSGRWRNMDNAIPAHNPRLSVAQSLQDQGRFLAAADILLEDFRQDPWDSIVARELGCVLHAAGDLVSAQEYLVRAHHANPSDARALSELVLVLRERDMSDEAAGFLLAGLNAGANPQEISGNLAA
jgi:tetratricopeptide (TPR) repeat protein